MESKSNILCQQHKNSRCEFIFLQKGINDLDKIEFLCKKCVVLGNFSLGYLIDIDQITNTTSDSEIIHNWPPLTQQQFFLQIDGIINSQNTQQSLVQKIEQQYNETKLYFNQKIDEYYKQALNKIHLYTQNYVLSVYNKICGVEKLKECFKINGQVDIEQLREIVKIQFKNMESNYNLLNLANEQYSHAQNSGIIFEQLQKKLSILFEKIDGKYKNDFLFTNLLEEQNEEQIEKIIFVNKANQQLKSLDKNILFEWKSFEEIQNGITIYLNQYTKERRIYFSKGFQIDYGINNLQDLQNNYNWWVLLNESFSNSGNRYITLYFNKKAKNFYEQDKQKNCYKINYFEQNVELVNNGQQLAKQLQNRVNEIINKYTQQKN
ncbi:hypothetical protein ABPG74_005288 [Tetrahymena malaccensis]